MQIGRFSFRQIVTNYKGLATIRQASWRRLHSRIEKLMKEDKSSFTWFYNSILFDDAIADAKNAFS